MGEEWDSMVIEEVYVVGEVEGGDMEGEKGVLM